MVATLWLNAATLAAVLLILGLLLKQHKVWVRMKDRLNNLWWHHCHHTGERYSSLDGNGH